MSKFIGPPWLVSAGVFPSARSLTSAARSLSRLLEGLDPLANLRSGRGIQLEFEQSLVGVDRHSRLAKGVRGLGEREESLLIGRLQPDERLVGADRPRRRRLVLDRGLLQLRPGLRRKRLGDRILPDRLAELP